MITFLELRIQKKSASEYWHISRELRKRSHFGACILVLESLSSSFLESHNLDAEQPFLQQHAVGELQSVASLEHDSFQIIKLKLAAFLPSAAPTIDARATCENTFF